MPTNFATMSEALAQLSSLATFLADMPAGVRAQVEAAVAEGEADLAALQAAVDALAVEVAAGVEGLIPSLAFEAVIDPADPNPTEINGGTFNTIADAVGSTSPGSLVTLALVAGQTHHMDEDVAVFGRTLHLTRVGSGSNPVVRPQVYLLPGGKNSVRNFQFGSRADLSMTGVDLFIPPDADPNESMSGAHVLDVDAGVHSVSLENVVISGNPRINFFEANRSGVIHLGGNNVTIDGLTAFDVRNNTTLVRGVGIVSLLNGGVLTVAGNGTATVIGI